MNGLEKVLTVSLLQCKMVTIAKETPTIDLQSTLPSTKRLLLLHPFPLFANSSQTFFRETVRCEMCKNDVNTFGDHLQHVLRRTKPIN